MFTIDWLIGQLCAFKSTWKNIELGYNEMVYRCELKSILFKSNLENSSSHKNFLNRAAIFALEARKYAAQLRKFLWLDEFSKLLLNKMDFS